MENSLRECIIKSQAKVPIYDSASLLKKKKWEVWRGTACVKFAVSQQAKYH